MRKSGTTKILSQRDLPAVRLLLDADPIANVMVAARVEQAGLDPWRLQAEMWGYFVEGEMQALCFNGANLVPIGAGETALELFAGRARRQGRRCSSIVGPAMEVLPLWRLLEPYWGKARDVRAAQPLMAISGPPKVVGHPGVRLVRPDELELFLPAAVAMYTEEIGFTPAGSDGGTLYRARVRDLIVEQRAFALVDGGRVLFKAEIGAVAGDTCQVQGVWVDPELRKRGLGTSCTASVVTAAQRDIAGVVSLYVNEHNTSARKAYENIGFETVGSFASILF